MALVHQVVWERCNVFDKDGNPTTYERGDLLPDGVDAVQLQHLGIFGAVRVMEAVPTEDEMKAEASSTNAQSGLQLPTRADNKDVWIAYATDERNPNRLSTEQAKSMSKDALMDRFTK